MIDIPAVLLGGFSLIPAGAKIPGHVSALREFLDGLSEEDFSNKAVSTPGGMQGKMEAMALVFREHFTNHKMQLFTYLNLLGLPVDTGTLYFGQSMG